MTLERTDEGKINKYLFSENILIWVEGADDLPFYINSCLDLECRFISAGGKEESNKLRKALIEEDLPYVVIVDGDYNVIEKKSRQNNRIIILDRYSIENYFFENELMYQLCKDYLCLKIGNNSDNADEIENWCGIVTDDFNKLVEECEVNLHQLIILDISNCKAYTGINTLPQNIDQLLSSTRGIVFNIEEIENRLIHLNHGLPSNIINDVIANVVRFIQERRFLDTIPGHLLFGLIRRFVGKEVRKFTHKAISIDNDSLILLLTKYMWSIVTSDDHVKLKAKLREAIKESAQLKAQP